MPLLNKNDNPNFMKRFLLHILALFVLSPLLGQHTMSLEEGQKSPPATIDQMSWLTGHWKGEAFGGIVEEIWAPPLGGSMMGAFKAEAKGEVNFYEIETISEVDGTLILRLKHFHSDLKGWEEKDDTVDFPLVKIEENKAWFSGFTIERISKKELNMYVVVGSKDGQNQEITFKYKRQKLK